MIKLKIPRLLQTIVILAFVGSQLTTYVAAQESSEKLQNWASWRGPLGSGESPDANPPTKWSESQNVKWKTAIPGLGLSTPVVWGNRIFLTTAVPVGEKFEPIPDNAPGSHDNLAVSQQHEFRVIAVDREKGKIAWNKLVHTAVPHHGGHYSGSLASGSPVADAKHVFAFFGSHGLFCMDHDGNEIWNRPFDKMQSKHGHGEGASPALHGDTIVVNWDHEAQSYVVALDKNTGDEKWKVEREEVTSWSSPIIIEHEGQHQVIVAGTLRTRAYDLDDGSVIWECGGLSGNVVATPIAQNGMLYVGSSYEKRAMFGIRLKGAKGDITGTPNVVWSVVQRTPYVPSPLLYDGQLYFLRHYQGVMSRVTAKTGEQPEGPVRLMAMRDIYASPIAANGRIYITSTEGRTVIYSHTEWPRMIGISAVDDEVSASLVPVGKELIIRGHKRLYLIAEEQSE